MTNLDLTEQLKTAVAQANRLRKQRDQLRAIIGRVLECRLLVPNPLLELVAERAMQETAPTLQDCQDQTAEVMTDALKKHLPDMPPVVVQPE